MDKKASFELSMNFIVVIIISMVLFGIGFQLISMIWQKSDQTAGDMDKFMQEKIASSLDMGQLVSVYPNRLTATRNKMVKLGVGISNELGEDEPGEFSIYVERDVDNSPDCDDIDEIYSDDSFEIKNNEKQYKLIGITFPGICTRGTHIYNIYVCQGVSYCDEEREEDYHYGNMEKIFIVLN